MRRDELVHGTIYRCNLTGLLMLVHRSTHTGPDPSDVRRQVTTSTVRAWYYNPVTGTYQWTSVEDGQLSPITALPVAAVKL